jgi:hypothetical protein
MTPDVLLLQTWKHQHTLYREAVVLTLSVYVDSDAVRLYRAGKASVWHAGVFLAAPTVKRGGVKSKV